DPGLGQRRQREAGERRVAGFLAEGGRVAEGLEAVVLAGRAPPLEQRRQPVLGGGLQRRQQKKRFHHESRSGFPDRCFTPDGPSTSRPRGSLWSGDSRSAGSPWPS